MHRTMDKSLGSVSLESDLMDAMNAALEDSERNDSIHSSSLQSVDVMDEAMMLLGSEGEIEIDDFEVDENVEFGEADSVLIPASLPPLHPLFPFDKNSAWKCK